MNKKIFLLFFTILFSPLFASAQTATTSFTTVEIGKHASSTDCWIIVSDKVYSVASYISMHPGGKSAISNFCGKDATKAFVTKGGKGKHSPFAQSTLGNFLVGDVIVSTSTENTTTYSTSTTATNTPELLFTACKQINIEKRDTGIIAARTAYTNAINTAMTKRKEGEKAAIALTDISAKKTALKKVLQEYKTSVKTAQETLTLSRKTILRESEIRSRTCKTEKDIQKENLQKKKDDTKNNKKSEKEKNEVEKNNKKWNNKED